ncbi:hypothetical protein QTP70_005341, partial [Hemibagrus guttatus]
MSVVCLPLSAGEDSFELHSVDLELEAVEKQIPTYRPSTPRTQPAQALFTPAPGYHAAWMQQQRKMRAKPRARTSPPPPPPVFEISTRNRLAPLCETECDAVIIGDSIVWHVRATAAKGKVRTRCLPGARVLDVFAQVPAILKNNIRAVVLHAGTNDITVRHRRTSGAWWRSHGVKIRNYPLLITGIFSGSILGSTVLMACTQAELEQQSSQTTSPGHYAPSD